MVRTKSLQSDVSGVVTLLTKMLISNQSQSILFVCAIYFIKLPNNAFYHGLKP